MIVLQYILCSLLLFSTYVHSFERNPQKLIAQITQEALDPLNTKSALIEKDVIPAIGILFRSEETETILRRVQKALPEMHFDHFLNRMLSYIISGVRPHQDYIYNEQDPLIQSLQLLAAFGATLDVKPMFYDICCHGGESPAAVIPPIIIPSERDIPEPEEAAIAYTKYQALTSLRVILQNQRSYYNSTYTELAEVLPDLGYTLTEIQKLYQRIFDIFSNSQIQASSRRKCGCVVQ